MKIVIGIKPGALTVDTSMPTIPSKGVYVFYEDNKPIYVGRSNRMRKRIKEHFAISSTHHSATFAFKLARTVAEKRYLYKND
jgi:excinuclease UvrABC nuclease subunit